MKSIFGTYYMLGGGNSVVVGLRLKNYIFESVLCLANQTEIIITSCDWPVFCNELPSIREQWKNDSTIILNNYWRLPNLDIFMNDCQLILKCKFSWNTIVLTKKTLDNFIALLPLINRKLHTLQSHSNYIQIVYRNIVSAIVEEDFSALPGITDIKSKIMIFKTHEIELIMEIAIIFENEIVDDVCSRIFQPSPPSAPPIT